MSRLLISGYRWAATVLAEGKTKPWLFALLKMRLLSECLADVLFGYRIAYLEFKSEAIAEKTMEEAQGSDVQGRSIIIDFTGEKSRQGSRSE